MTIEGYAVLVFGLTETIFFYRQIMMDMTSQFLESFQILWHNM